LISLNQLMQRGVIHTRVATKDDAVLIANISQECFYHAFISSTTAANMDMFLKQQFTKGKLMLEVGAKENIFLLAYDEDELVGYAKLRDASRPLLLQQYKSLELARLYAMPARIGAGVGTVLMKEAISIAREMGKDVIWLGVWEGNKRAIKFYESFGFEKFADTDFLLGEDLQQDWLMKKNISSNIDHEPVL